MKIIAIGRGGAWAPMSIGNSNFLFEEDGKFMMFDFGLTAFHTLRDEMKFDLGDISALYISHAHADHCTLEPFLFYRYFVPNKSGKPVRPKLYVHSDFIQPLWNNTLKGGLDALHGKVAALTDYCECFPIHKNKSFIFEGIKMTPFQTTHVNFAFSIRLSYGLLIENPKTGKSCMISGDTVFNPSGLNYLYERADLILHDVEVSANRSHVHPHITDLSTLSPEIKSKMYLYHYSELPEDPDQYGFAGFVEKFQEFNI